MYKKILPVLFIALLLSAPAFAGFDEGKKAYDTQDWAVAIANLRPLAENGDSRAQVLLGTMYAEGYGVEEDMEEAFKLYRAAAQKDNLDAILAVATMYRGGLGVPENIKYAIEWSERGARLGDTPSALFYGLYLFEGNKSDAYDFKPNHPEAYKWFRVVAKSPNAKLAAAGQRLAENLAKTLTPEEIKQGDAAAAAWKPEESKDLGPAPDIAAQSLPVDAEKKP